MSRVEYVTVEIEHEVAKSAQDWPAVEFAGLHGLIHNVRVLGVVEREADHDLPTSVSTIEEMRALPQGATLRDTDGETFVKADTDTQCWMCIGTAVSRGHLGSWYGYEDVVLPATIVDL